MKVCSVAGCKGPDTPDPVFFELPSSRLLRKRWLDAINCSSADDGAAVCIRHFTREDYELVRGAATLRSRSVPSRRIRESDDENSDESESESSDSGASERTQKKNTSNDNRTHNVNKDNGKINNDIGKISKDIAKVNNDNGKLNNDHGNEEKHIENKNKDNQIENGPTEDNSSTENVNTVNNSRLNNEHNDNGKLTDNVEKSNNDIEMLPDNDGKTSTDNGKLCNDKEIRSNDGVTENNDKVTVNNDNETVNNDNGKNEKKVHGKKTRCKITAMRTINGRRKFSSCSDSSSDSDNVHNSARPEPEGGKEDIEEALQHYYIENKKTERQVAAMTDVINEQEKRSEECWKEVEVVPLGLSAPPVFIELSVGQAGPAAGPGAGAGVGAAAAAAESDCLMVLESVQCDVDPTLLIAAREEDEANMVQVDLDDEEDDDVEIVPKKKDDPISLLTSSDEDDVIIQEPKYDTVEVSSGETSEDDMPLVKLVKPSSQNEAKKMKLSAKRTKNLITKLLWGRKDFYCAHCRFTTTNASEYTKHMATHTSVLSSQHKVIQYCQECGFATSSKHQIQKHKQKHKNEKRFKCNKCNYSAKHKMSLVYHMKTHENSGTNEVELAICGTYEPPSERSEKSKKSRLSETSKVSESDKKYICKPCGYKTNRRSDLKRHLRRIHDGDDGDEDDDEYVP